MEYVGQTTNTPKAAPPGGSRRKQAPRSGAERRACAEPRPAPAVRLIGPVAWLSRQSKAGDPPFLSAEEVQAAERFGRDFYQAGMEVRVTMNLGAVSTGRSRQGGAEHMSITAMDARDRLRAACQMLGPDLANFTLDAVGYELGLAVLEKRYNWPVRSGKVALKLALQVLKGYYQRTEIARR